MVTEVRQNMVYKSNRTVIWEDDNHPLELRVALKKLYGVSEVIVDDSSDIEYRSRFKRTDKLHKCKRFFGK